MSLLQNATRQVVLFGFPDHPIDFFFFFFEDGASPTSASSASSFLSLFFFFFFFFSDDGVLTCAIPPPSLAISAATFSMTEMFFLGASPVS